MGLLRSEQMTRGTLWLPVQGAHRNIDIIGRKTKLQFEDMNAREMRRPYRKYIQRIDEMERILRFVFDEINRQGLSVTKNKFDQFLEGTSGGNCYKLNSVEAELKKIYTMFSDLKDKNTRLQIEHNVEMEDLEVCKTALELFSSSNVAARMVGAPEQRSTEPGRASLLAEDSMSERRLGCVAGVVSIADEMRFSRALWRASRGNTFAQFKPIDTPMYDAKSDTFIKKSVFVIYFQGMTGSAMQSKLTKVCAAFGTNIYNWPVDEKAANERIAMLTASLATKSQVLNAHTAFMISETAELLKPSDTNISGNSKIEEWRLFCVAEKSIYTTLNLCESAGDGLLLMANVWFPTADANSIQDILKSETTGMNDERPFLKLNSDHGKAAPPTYIRTNDFTCMWQEVISTYGVPRYQEANPALISTVTFPFIFGMMYGDIGHGFLLMLAGAWLIKQGDRFKISYPPLFQCRYMIFQLGLYAIFAGFIYNDFFSVGLQLFSSGFEDKEGNGVYTPTYDVKNTGGPGPYPFGLDWAWHGAENELLYVNSLKMKLSVLFGVLQMTVGLIFRFSNAVYFRNMTDFFCECIPFMMFMLCFFGWMDYMILYKWTHSMENPPMLINSLICMAMGQEDKLPLFPGSVELATQLMMVCVLVVPVMLIPKPISLWLQNKASKKAETTAEGHKLLTDVEAGDSQASGHGHGEEFEIGEIVIHQVIETIEYVLGVVSHTASYLRIWALSLAHQQLSLVFFQKTIQMGLEMTFPFNGIMIYLMFCMWFLITVGVLMGMDVLECFLHTLRLHWVEFDQKFFKGDGYKFEPYDIKATIIASGEDN